MRNILSAEPPTSPPSSFSADEAGEQFLTALQCLADRSNFPNAFALERVSPDTQDDAGFWRGVIPSTSKPAPVCTDDRHSSSSCSDRPAWTWAEVSGGTAIIGKDYLVLSVDEDPAERTIGAMRTLTGRFLHTLQDGHNELEFDGIDVLPQGNVSLYVQELTTY